jgi:succinate dehydrogenase (ubiquinone) cytochrome b560 subunit
VFEIDMKSAHYKMPVNAITSVLSRGTGVALYAAAAAGAYAALATPDAALAVAAWAAAHPVLAVPAKAAVAFPLAYHYAAGVRHLWWDVARHGNQAAHAGPLEKSAVDASSYAVLGASAAATLAALVV